MKEDVVQHRYGYPKFLMPIPPGQRLGLGDIARALRSPEDQREAQGRQRPAAA
jgi:hypothetical protein